MIKLIFVKASLIKGRDQGHIFKIGRTLCDMMVLFSVTITLLLDPDKDFFARLIFRSTPPFLSKSKARFLLFSPSAISKFFQCALSKITVTLPNLKITLKKNKEKIKIKKTPPLPTPHPLHSFLIYSITHL